MTRKVFQVGDAVYDRWWPWLTGCVVKVNKTSLYVQGNGQVWRYDRAHQQFLEPLLRPGRKRSRCY